MKFVCCNQKRREPTILLVGNDLTVCTFNLSISVNSCNQSHGCCPRCVHRLHRKDHSITLIGRHVPINWTVQNNGHVHQFGNWHGSCTDYWNSAYCTTELGWIVTICVLRISTSKEMLCWRKLNVKCVYLWGKRNPPLPLIFFCYQQSTETIISKARVITSQWDLLTEAKRDRSKIDSHSVGAPNWTFGSSGSQDLQAASYLKGELFGW